MKPMHSNIQLTREDLELVRTIAEEGTVTRAALRLHLSQSALSHHLRTLEDRLGTAIFHRHSRSMQVTSLGEELTSRAQKICTQFRESEEELASIINCKRKIVRLGTECFTTYHWLPKLVRKMARSSPNVELRIVVEATQRARAALDSGETDAAIISSRSESSRVRYWPLFKDELMLLVNVRHPLAEKKYVEAKDLASESLFLHSIPSKHQPVVDEFFVPANTYPRQIRNVQLTEAIIEMVRAQMGIGILPYWLIDPYVSNGDLKAIQLGRSGLFREWRMAAMKTNQLLAEIEQIAKALSHHLRP